MVDGVDMVHRAQLLLWAVGSLLALAVLMINSTVMGVGGEPVTLERLMFGRPTLYAVIAIAVMWATSYIDVRGLYKIRGAFNPIPWLLLASIVLCGVALLPGVGAELNASRRWLFLGPRSWGLTFQPSELAKWVMVAAVAWWCARRAGAMRKFFVGLLPIMLIVGFVCGLIVVEDLGTSVLIGTVAVAMLLVGGAKVWQMLLIVPGAIGAVVGMIVIEPYRMQRLMVFLNPYADADGAGYQPIQMMAAIANGNRGLGNGIAKQGYVPAETTDAILAIICEELGLAGAALVMGLLLVLVWTMVGIVKDSKWGFGRMLAFGVMLTLGIQAVMNIAVVTVVVPTKGIALPFVSSGGTGWVLGAAMVGLVAALDRINRLTSEVELGETFVEKADGCAKPQAAAPSISATDYPTGEPVTG
jgi:cell division protein FtsW